MNDEVGAVQDRSFAGASAVTNTAYPPERRLTAARIATAAIDPRLTSPVGAASLASGRVIRVLTACGSIRDCGRKMGGRRNSPSRTIASGWLLGIRERDGGGT